MTSSTINDLIPYDEVCSLEDEFRLFSHPENLDSAVLGIITRLLANDTERFEASGINESDIRNYLVEELDMTDGL